jgi:biotin carboxyl carrier protein
MAEVLSPTTATLIELYCETGTEVAEGENIGCVEVMKQMHYIEAPTSGTLRWLVELGDFLEDGQVIGVIE